jgi:FkbM family methyltransferase
VGIDVGAYVGTFSRELLDSNLFAQVVAFEPNPACAEQLERLAASDARLTLVRSAVGEAQGQADLHADRNAATASVLPYAAGYRTDGPVARLSVPMVTLDAYREQQLQGRAVALLKVDTQGHDLAVLKGAARLIASDRPLVVVELIYVPMYDGQAEPCEIFAYLGAGGYVLYSAFNLHATAEGRLAFADALFVPGELAPPASQEYVQIDDHDSLRAQIRILEGICQERLDVINVLDAEVKRLSR